MENLIVIALVVGSIGYMSKDWIIAKYKKFRSKGGSDSGDLETMTQLWAIREKAHKEGQHSVCKNITAALQDLIEYDNHNEE